MSEHAQHGDVGTKCVHVGRLGDLAADALCALGRSLGLHCERVDLAGCADKEGLLERVAQGLNFPSWFGGNWDALFDCLADLSWCPAPGYLLVLEHADELRQHAPEVFDTAVLILGDVAAAWEERGIRFRAFVGIDR